MGPTRTATGPSTKVPRELSTFFVDADGDGFGDDANTVEACAAGPGLSETGGDCDDSNADVNPEATEICNGLDADCSGYADEELLRAGEPVPLGYEGLSLGDTFLPFGDGYFFAYFDEASATHLYMRLDTEGTVTTGPLRVATTPAAGPFLFTIVLDADRILVTWLAEIGEGVGLIARVLRPADPGNHSDQVTVLPQTPSPSGAVVLDDRVVAYGQSGDEIVAYTYDLDLGDSSGEIIIPSGGELVRYLGVPDSDVTLVARFDDAGSTLSPVDPTTLAKGAPVDVDFANSGLTGDTPPGIRVQTDTVFSVTWIDAVMASGELTIGETIATDLAVPAVFEVLGLTPVAGRYLAMACAEDGTEQGESMYQYLRLDGTKSAPVPFRSDDLEFDVPWLAAQGSSTAGMLIGSSDLDTVTPELHFVPFECPAP